MKKFLAFLFISTLLLGKDINVGDLVRFKVSGMEKEKILEELKGKDILLEEIKEEGNGYILSLRAFKVGENSFNLGNKKVTLDVKSVLDENDKEIYPNLSDKSDTKLHSEKFPYSLILGVITGVISLIYLVKNLKFKRKEKVLSPEEKFEKDTAVLEEKEWDFQLSMAIREYIDKKYSTSFTKGEYKKVGVIDDEDIKFINNLDRYKFSLDERDLKEEILKKIREIFIKVREDRKDV